MTSVSVIIPSYNHEPYLHTALESVIQQDHDDLEIICVDDGSTDGSIQVAHEILSRSGRRHQLIAQDNKGAHAAMERGAAVARGDLLMFLNSDDLYGPRRVSLFGSLWEHAQRNPAFWGFSLAFFIDETGSPVDPITLGVGHLSYYTAWVREEQWVNELFTWHNVMLTSGNLVVTSEHYRRTGGFASYRMVHDWDIALKLLVHGGPLIIQEPLYGYRLHGSNTFRNIAEEEAVNESERVRDVYRTSLMTRIVSEPYSRRGTPFVDYLRMSVPMKAPMSGS